MAKTEEALTLKLARTLNASPERVFAALTQAEHIARWFGPSPEYTVEVQEWDCRSGGAYRISLKHSDGTVHTVHGEFREIEENRLVSYTWSWVDDPMDSLVTIRVREEAGKSALELTQVGFPNEEVRDKHREGWTGSLERLAGALA